MSILNALQIETPSLRALLGVEDEKSLTSILAGNVSEEKLEQ